jgi:hypothetical protein
VFVVIMIIGFLLAVAFPPLGFTFLALAFCIAILRSKPPE